MNEKIIILDFGSQYTQLIARRVRELNVYCEIHPFNKKVELDDSVKGVVLSGSPFSVLQENAPQVDLQRYIGNKPLLCVCYGAQYLAHHHGGQVQRSQKREYGKASLEVKKTDSPLFENVSNSSQVWMSHGDTIFEIGDNFEILASTNDVEVAAYGAKEGAFDHPVYALQFHPEVTHSLEGSEILKNFIINISGCSGSWTPESYIEETVNQLRNRVGDKSVLLGLSGGVDSTVAAVLLQKAIGDRLHCFFIDNGLLRKNEYEQVLESYNGLGLQVYGINAQREFYDALKDVSDPEKKRKAIGRVFIEVFEREAKKMDNIAFLGQGTIYPDVIESVSVHGPSVTIKSHHNVGGLPEKLDLEIVEPLRMLFKDEVRRVGKSLGIGHHILGRHPFPGPGLAIRILGDITEDKVKILQEADNIFISKLKEHDLYDQVWQSGVILLPVQSVGVMGDERTYERAVALRSVNSVDGMTAEWSKLPHDFLAEVSSEIINKVKGINRVVYDISTKPPATIEWE